MRRQRPHRFAREAYDNEDDQFHLTLRAHPRFQTWPIPVRDAIWSAALNERDRDSVHLFAACLMPDHMHLLVAPRSRNIIAFVDGFKTWTTRQAWASGANGAIWQPGMWDRTIRGEDDFDAVADYIVRNPVNEGLCESEKDWPYTWVWWWSDGTH